MTTDLAKRDKDGMLAVPIAPTTLDLERDEIIIPRCHLYQGTGMEEETFGKYDRGTWLDTITGDVMAVPNEDAPPYTYDGISFVCAFTLPRTYVAYNEAGEIEYITTDRGDVPKEHLLFGSALIGAGKRCVEVLSVVCVFAGYLDLPRVVRFKKTSFNSGKALDAFERARGKRGPGLYTFTVKKKDGAKGPYLIPNVRPIGDPPADMLEALVGFREAYASLDLRVDDADMKGKQDGDVPF